MQGGGALGALGARRFASGSWLVVRRAPGEWVDTWLEADGAPPCPWPDTPQAALALHPWNHAPRQLPMSACTAAWREAMRARHSRVADVLTGRELDVMEQCVSIDITGPGSGSGHGSTGEECGGPVNGNERVGPVNGDETGETAIHDAASLVSHLARLHEGCCNGRAVDAPLAVLLTAGPATGKTSLLSQVRGRGRGRGCGRGRGRGHGMCMALTGDPPPRRRARACPHPRPRWYSHSHSSHHHSHSYSRSQVVMHCLDGELVPILIKVQQLQAQYVAAPDAFAAAWNWVDAYVCIAHGGSSSPVYRMLRQALLSRRAPALLGGTRAHVCTRTRTQHTYVHCGRRAVVSSPFAYHRSHPVLPHPPFPQARAGTARRS